MLYGSLFVPFSGFNGFCQGDLLVFYRVEELVCKSSFVWKLDPYVSCGYYGENQCTFEDTKTLVV